MVAKAGGEKGIKRISNFFRGVRAEIKKITWPNKKELITYTTVVLVTCALMALVVWILDVGLHGTLRLIIG